jgi:hypothetical protein
VSVTASRGEHYRPAQGRRPFVGESRDPESVSESSVCEVPRTSLGRVKSVETSKSLIMENWYDYFS